jgi:hypothetical protein
MSLKTIILDVYQMINTQAPVGAEENTSSMDSITYGETLSKLFIVSILGTRLHSDEKIFFARIEYGSPRGTLIKRPWLRHQG